MKAPTGLPFSLPEGATSSNGIRFWRCESPAHSAVSARLLFCPRRRWCRLLFPFASLFPTLANLHPNSAMLALATCQGDSFSSATDATMAGANYQNCCRKCRFARDRFVFPAGSPRDPRRPAWLGTGFPPRREPRWGEDPTFSWPPFSSGADVSLEPAGGGACGFFFTEAKIGRQAST